MDDKSFTIRIPRRWGQIALTLVVVAMIVAPLTAVASHTFNDVPNTHTFHNDITWLADADVTKGCNPPTNDEFCPDDAVTRGQMSAFMHRLADNQVVDAGELDGKSSTAYETRVAADGCHINSNASATSCGDDDDGTVPDHITREHASVTVNAPTSGTLQIDGYVITNAAMWFTLNESCAAYNAADLVPIFQQLVNGTLFGGTTATIGTANTAVSVSSGNQTVRLCGAYESTDGGGVVLNANLTASWTAGGSVSTASAPSSGGAAITGGLLGSDTLVGG